MWTGREAGGGGTRVVSRSKHQTTGWRRSFPSAKWPRNFSTGESTGNFSRSREEGSGSSEGGEKEKRKSESDGGDGLPSCPAGPELIYLRF